MLKIVFLFLMAGGVPVAVPAANIALLRRYEPDIKRYAMTGLEWIGM